MFRQTEIGRQRASNDRGEHLPIQSRQ